MIKYKKGFTLIELLIYIAIFGTVAGILSGVLATFVRIQSQQTASASVSQELAFVQTTIQRLVRESVNIENTAGVASSTLILRMASSTLDRTIISISSDGNAINLQQGVGGVIQPLTSDRVKVSQFQAVKYENPGGHAITQIDLSLTYNSSKVYQQITQNLKLSIGRVTAATFDDSLIPNIDNTYSIGVSPYSWKNAAFSGNLTVGGNVGIGTTTPTATLHLQAGSGSAFQRFSDGTDTYQIGVNMGGGTALNFQTISGANLLSLGKNGNVGIGTTTPVYALDVGGAGASNKYSRLGGMSILTANSGYEWWTGSYTSTGPWQLTYTKISDSSWTNALTVLTNGNVGIGTTDPGSYKLNVAGNTKIQGNLDVTGNITGGTGGWKYSGIVKTATCTSTGIYYDLDLSNIFGQNRALVYMFVEELGNTDFTVTFQPYDFNLSWNDFPYSANSNIGMAVSHLYGGPSNGHKNFMMQMTGTNGKMKYACSNYPITLQITILGYTVLN